MPVLRYQWWRDGTPLLGATQACYTLPACHLTDSGAQFFCTVSNLYGVVTSAPVQLTVATVKLESPVRQADGNIGFTLWNPPGGVTELWVSPDLWDWSLLETVTNTHGTLYYNDPGTNSMQRYFRLRVLLPPPP